MTFPPDHHRLEPGHLPTPFSAAEISDACAPGRRNVFRVEEAGGEPHLLVWEFTGGDGEIGVGRRHVESLDRVRVGPWEESSATWSEYQGHASYPAATTELAAVDVDVEAGRFGGWRYRSRSGDGTVTTAWFARDLPGPPVLVEVESGGTVVHRTELIEFIDPRS